MAKQQQQPNEAPEGKRWTAYCHLIGYKRRATAQFLTRAACEAYIEDRTSDEYNRHAWTMKLAAYSPDRCYYDRCGRLRPAGVRQVNR